MALAALIAVVVAGCSGGESAPRETLSADAYYEQMKVGDFADFTEAQLDSIGKSLCEDLGNMEADERPQAVQVLRQSTDTEQESFEVGQAITGRWCPEYVEAFDY